MRTLYCSICSTNFDVDTEGVEGDIGIIPVAFCATCRTGIHDFAQQTWDLVPRDMLHLGAKEEDCGCPENAELHCISVICPRR